MKLMCRVQRAASYCFKKWTGQLPLYPITLQPSGSPRGRALLSYIPNVLNLPEDAPELAGHANKWRSREIAQVLVGLGFSVDAIWYNDHTFVPKRPYTIAFDIYTNLARLAPALSDETIKIMYCTGSDPFYQNAAERARVEAVNRRRQGTYTPKRLVTDPEGEMRSLEIADAILLLGNDRTLQTFPPHLHQRIQLIHATPSRLGNNVKTAESYVPSQREFLWFFGSGAVHKGLDLVLEVFARNPRWVLNIIGPVAEEADFGAMYAHEMTEMPNIRYHGPLEPSGEAFRAVAWRSFCVIAPSCSEAMSSAVVTMLHVGLYPIITRDTGVTLPTGCGILLETAHIDELEAAVRQTYQLSDEVLRNQIGIIHNYAATHYTSARYRLTMETFISNLVMSRAAGKAGKTSM